MRNPFSLSELLGPRGPGISTAMEASLRVLQTNPPSVLLERVGQVLPEIPAFEAIDKAALQDSYGGSQTGPSEDFLTGQGLFYITEQRRLFLDGTAGHYQMLWGYNHPVLNRVLEEGARAGIVWDNHSNIPQAPVKQLARRLLELANAPGEPDPIDTVLLGVCTGSVACAAALKIQLKVYEATRSQNGQPVLLVLEGNYHGTDMVAQTLRGMWPQWVHAFEVIALPPNRPEALELAFQKHGARVAGFWAEPVMMNREALAVQRDYLQLARRRCEEVGALLCIDEIQTCCWQPEVFAYRALDLHPDLVIAGKGMTAGFHPLAAVLYKQRYDVLAQYDAISTNGSAAMPSLIGLASLELIRQNADRIRSIAQKIQGGFAQLALDFPEQIVSAQGHGYLSGIKFRRVRDALAFHQAALARGIWTRVHAYHEGHSTLLTKLGLLADEEVVDFLFQRLRLLFQEQQRSVP